MYIVVDYIPLSAKGNNALGELHDNICFLQNKHPETLFVIACGISHVSLTDRGFYHVTIVTQGPSLYNIPDWVRLLTPAKVLAGILNISHSQAKVPSYFKAGTVIPVPKTWQLTHSLAFSSTHSVKFADDTAVMRLISSDDKSTDHVKKMMVMIVDSKRVPSPPLL